jgi:hypothetical protein
MKLIQLSAILVLSASILTQRVSAGPIDTIRSFFGARPQPTHIHPHPRPIHKDTKDAKDAPNDSSSPTVSPGDQQPNGSPGPNALSNTANRPGRPNLAAAPLY